LHLNVSAGNAAASSKNHALLKHKSRAGQSGSPTLAASSTETEENLWLVSLHRNGDLHHPSG
jgi:hypothetical protein